MKKKVLRRAAVKLVQELAEKQRQLDVMEVKLEALNDQLTDALDKLTLVHNIVGCPEAVGDLPEWTINYEGETAPAGEALRDWTVFEKLREQDTPTRDAMRRLKATMSTVLPEGEYQPIPRYDASGAYNPEWTYKKDGPR